MKKCQDKVTSLEALSVAGLGEHNVGLWAVHGTQSNFRGRRTTGIPLAQIGCEKGWMRKYTFVSNWMAVNQARNEATRVVNWLSIHKLERWGLPLDGRAECAGQPLGRPTHGLEKWPAARAAYCKCNCVGHGNLRAQFETKLHWKSALAQIFAWSSSPSPSPSFNFKSFAFYSAFNLPLRFPLAPLLASQGRVL